MTIEGFSSDYTEEYSAVGATATISRVGEKLVWAFDHGGVRKHGEITIHDGDMGRALWAARKTVDREARALLHPVKPTEDEQVAPPEPPAAPPVVAAPEKGDAETK